jgi:formylglycine-generating enzyme required for sulfatase activity
VVGNARYEDSPLANPVNDATDMAKELTRLGFAVTLRTNQNADQMKELISDFGDQLARSKGVGLFYFAGHGVQVDGRNYLLPVGRRYRREKDVELFAVESRAVLARMGEAGNPLNIVILDACRDSPLPPESRSAGSRGLARDTAPSGALIAYATAPGSTADDRRGARNGLYTGHLLQALREPGLRLEDVFGRVRDAVERDSARQQSPEEVVKLRGQPFYFMPPVASAGSPPVLSPPPAPRPEPVAPSGPRVGDVFRDCAECPEMVVLPSGNFDMGDLHGDGDSDEKPVRTVRIGQPFALGKYEVTVGAFRRFVAASGYRTDAERNAGAKGCYAWDASDGKFDWREGRDWRSPGFGQEDSHPVVCVSWNDAQAYIKWLSKESGQRYRLASEAEFEYALRAGGRTKWPWGDDANGGLPARQRRGPDERTLGAKLEQQARMSGRALVFCPGGSFSGERLRAARHERKCMGVGAGLL